MKTLKTVLVVISMLLASVFTIAGPASATDCQELTLPNGTVQTFCGGPFIIDAASGTVFVDHDGQPLTFQVPPVYVPNAFNRGLCTTLTMQMTCADVGIVDTLPTFNNGGCVTLTNIGTCDLPYPDPNRTINDADPRFGCVLNNLARCETQFPSFDRNINNAGKFGCFIDAYGGCAFTLPVGHILGAASIV